MRWIRKVFIVVLSLWFIVDVSMAQAVDPMRYPQGLSSTALKQADRLKPNSSRKQSSKKTKIKARSSKDFSHLKHLSFVLKSTSFHGNKVIDSANLRHVFQSYFGKKISVAKLQELVNEVTNAYLKKGFILSHAYLPPQSIDSGEVAVNIVEGYIHHVKIVGDISDSNRKLIRALVRAVNQSVPLDTTVLESAILRVNRLPGITARAVLAPNKGVRKAADLSIVVKKDDASYFMQVHNLANKMMGRYSFVVGGSVYEPSIPGSRTSVSYGQAKKKVDYMMTTVMQQFAVGNDGDEVVMRGSWVRNKPDYTAIGLPVVWGEQGTTNQLMLSYYHSVLATRGRVKDVLFSLENNDSKFMGGDGNPRFHDIISSLRVKLSSMETSKLTNDANLGIVFALSKGMEWFGAKVDPPSRTNGKIDYFKANLQLDYTMPLMSAISFKGSIFSQYSMDVLLASEEFSVGGPQCGRGYDSGEMMGDKGVCSHNELIAQLSAVKKHNIQVYVFYDIGKIWNNEAVATDQIEEDHASSSGYGLRFLPKHNFFVDFFLAKPLDHDVGLEANRNARFFFNISFFGLI